MSQLVALGVKPVEFDLAKALTDANNIGRQRQLAQIGDQNIAQEQQATALGALKLKQEQGEASALEGYRTGMQNNNPAAAEASLKGYPEIHAKLTQAYESITDHAEKKKVKARLDALMDGVKQIAAYPEGDPQRTAVGSEVVDAMVKAGHITAEQAARAKQSGFSNLFLSQYLPLDEWMARTFPKSDPVKDARAENIRSDTENDKRVTEATVTQKSKSGESADALTENRKAKTKTEDELRDDKEAKEKSITEKNNATAGNANARTNKTVAETDLVPDKKRQIQAATDKLEAQARNERFKPETDIAKAETELRKSLWGGRDYIKDDEVADIEAKVKTFGAEQRAKYAKTAKAPATAAGSFTRESPAKPTTKVEYDALPSGAFYVKNGKLKQKK